MKPPRGYEALRRHRITVVDVSYFVTMCTRDRQAGLNNGEPAEAIARELFSTEADGAVAPRAWVTATKPVRFSLAREQF
ncbi:MAG: hypothetical protein HY736_09810, partial [Verrucomicrobia bacterium]|nr:hypothetical protein [Verrucomicrobiota bacterium]